MGETKKVEGTRAGTSVAASGRTPEAHQPSLLRMQGQSVLLKPLGKYFHHPRRVIFKGERQDRVVGVSDEKSRAFQSWLDDILKPHIQHLMKKYLGQDRRDNTALR